MILVYSSDCGYCQAIKRAVAGLDVSNQVELVPIESDRGRQLVTDVHGEYVHSPHLLTDEYVYYGVGPVAKQLALRFPNIMLGNRKDRISRAMSRF